jgi:hypothetical protein
MTNLSFISNITLVVVLFFVAGCDKNDNTSNGDGSHLLVTYEIEDLNGGEIWAEELRYKDEAGIEQQKFNYQVSNRIWEYQAQFEKGSSLLLYYEEYVQANDATQDYRLTIYVEGQIKNETYLTIQPGQVKSEKLEDVVESP